MAKPKGDSATGREAFYASHRWAKNEATVAQVAEALARYKKARTAATRKILVDLRRRLITWYGNSESAIVSEVDWLTDSEGCWSTAMAAMIEARSPAKPQKKRR